MMGQTQSKSNTRSQSNSNKKNHQKNEELQLFVPIHQHHEFYQIQIKLHLIYDRKMSIQQIFECLEYFDECTNMNSSESFERNNSESFDRRRREDRNPYHMLEKYYSKEIIDIFSSLAYCILVFSQKWQEIPILVSRNEPFELNLSKYQVFYLLSLMSLNLVPPQPYHFNHLDGRFNKRNNFRYIFTEQDYKTRTIMEYFKEMIILKKIDEKQRFIIRRETVIGRLSDIIKEEKKQMKEFEIFDDQQTIEKYVGLGKVDFANKFVGGGVLHRGCVQQQIMFSNHPQMFVSIILCEVMDDREAIIFRGFKKYSDNIGYGYDNTKYAGQQSRLNYQYENGLANEVIIAIDAVEFKNNEEKQFERKFVQREILKAYAGFNILQIDHIVTGNWGCGAFKGNIQLKFMIQWIACSLANKKMLYCPYGSAHKLTPFLNMYHQLKAKSIDEIYKILIEACSSMQSVNQRISDKISDKLRSENASNKFCGGFFNFASTKKQQPKPRSLQSKNEFDLTRNLRRKKQIEDQSEFIHEKENSSSNKTQCIQKMQLQEPCEKKQVKNIKGQFLDRCKSNSGSEMQNQQTLKNLQEIEDEEIELQRQAQILAEKQQKLKFLKIHMLDTDKNGKKNIKEDTEH